VVKPLKMLVLLGYMNGLGFRDLGNVTDADESYKLAPNAGRIDLTQVDSQSSGFHQEALIPLESETHSGEDVIVFAQGPGADLVSGTNEQNMVFHVISRAAKLHRTVK
jgi:alkaline phosphatase